MENQIESNGCYSTDKQGFELPFTPPILQEIGTSLEEVSSLLENLRRSVVAGSVTSDELNEADKHISGVKSLIERWLTFGGDCSLSAMQEVRGKVSTSESEKMRVMAASEMRKQRFLAKIDKVIEENMEGGNVDIDCLTDSLCMSRSTLYRRVKTMTGMSANEYIRHKRMEIAKELLIDGELPVSEIAYKVGCSSMSYFRQTFKDVYGVIPSEYLRNLKSS